MIFTLGNIVNSLAGVLKERFPEYPVYDNPNQQGTDWPCFFIFFMPSTIENQPGGRFFRDLGVDIVFVQERNLPDGNVKIHEIAEYLDEALEVFPYSDDGEEEAVIRTYERQWKTEDEELHYQFHIRQRVSVPKMEYIMEEMEEDVHAR